MEEKVVKPKKNVKNLIGKIVTIFFASLIGILLASQLIGSITAKDNYGVPNFFGNQTLLVLTDSMEPTYKVDEAIFVKKIDDLSTLKASTTPEAKDGDTITFYNRSLNIVVTHRIIEVIENEDGSIDFLTLGDNLNAQTCLAIYKGPCTVANADFVKGEYVLGVVSGKSAFIGQAIKLSSSPVMILLIAVIPLIYIFTTSVVDIVKTSKMKEEDFTFEAIDEFEAIKQQEKLKLLIEIEKEKLRKELEKELQNNMSKEEEEHGER